MQMVERNILTEHAFDDNSYIIALAIAQFLLSPF